MGDADVLQPALRKHGIVQHALVEGHIPQVHAVEARAGGATALEGDPAEHALPEPEAGQVAFLKQAVGEVDPVDVALAKPHAGEAAA